MAAPNGAQRKISNTAAGEKIETPIEGGSNHRIELLTTDRGRRSYMGRERTPLKAAVAWAVDPSSIKRSMFSGMSIRTGKPSSRVRS
jgi:hypothetical protein